MNRSIFQPQFSLKKGHGHAAFLFIKVADKISKLSKVSNQFYEKELLKNGATKGHDNKNKKETLDFEDLKVLNVNELLVKKKRDKNEENPSQKLNSGLIIKPKE